MKRVQRKGFYDKWKRRHPNAVYVGRPSRWGNPFKLSEYDLQTSLNLYKYWLEEKLLDNPAFLEPLFDKDLCCFCPLDKPCHADILLEAVKKDMKTKYECYGMGFVSEEKCGECGIVEECKHKHDCDMEEYALLVEHEKMYGGEPDGET